MSWQKAPLDPYKKAKQRKTFLGWALAYVVCVAITSATGSDIPFFVLMGVQLIKQSPDKLLQVRPVCVRPHAALSTASRVRDACAASLVHRVTSCRGWRSNLFILSGSRPLKGGWPRGDPRFPRAVAPPPLLSTLHWLTPSTVALRLAWHSYSACCVSMQANIIC
jgi:hypothetical protein